ncbi:unnamed protein product [Acanthosepion pharaonis]|uniref:Uncharacterized protein n=1 Tax=Acanthosepion pharaonis TaxID=158019 RepID=A0A812E6N2_ACAPH|nr:unnamed protein product [Sepia pharaonis]
MREGRLCRSRVNISMREGRLCRSRVNISKRQERLCTSKSIILAQIYFFSSSLDFSFLLFPIDVQFSLALSLLFHTTGFKSFFVICCLSHPVSQTLFPCLLSFLICRRHLKWDKILSHISFSSYVTPPKKKPRDYGAFPHLYRLPKIPSPPSFLVRYFLSVPAKSIISLTSTTTCFLISLSEFRHCNHLPFFFLRLLFHLTPPIQLVATQFFDHVLACYFFFSPNFLISILCTFFLFFCLIFHYDLSRLFIITFPHSRLFFFFYVFFIVFVFLFLSFPFLLLLFSLPNFLLLSLSPVFTSLSLFNVYSSLFSFSTSLSLSFHFLIFSSFSNFLILSLHLLFLSLPFFICYFSLSYLICYCSLSLSLDFILLFLS